MPEHKFRAWDIKNKKYIEIIGFYYFDDHIVLWFLDGGIPNYKNYHVKGIILEQYAFGLTDKDDTPICQGDIADSSYGIGTVVLTDRGFLFEFDIDTEDLWGMTVGIEKAKFKIISHIHEKETK